MDDVHYKFEYKERILFKYYFGLISLEFIKNSWLNAMSQNIITSDTLGFVLDYRKASFNFEINKYVELAHFYQEYPNVFGNRRIAFVTERPNDIVYPMLLQIWAKGYETKPFSTIEAAMHWIYNSIPKSNLMDIVSE